jgi:hypothetical protein
MRRKDPNKMTTKNQRKRMRRKGPNRDKKTAGADKEKGPK